MGRSYARRDGGRGILRGVLLELSLSVDNIFVFVIVFSELHIPADYQRRVLCLGRHRRAGLEGGDDRRRNRPDPTCALLPGRGVIVGQPRSASTMSVMLPSVARQGRPVGLIMRSTPSARSQGLPVMSEAVSSAVPVTLDRSFARTAELGCRHGRAGRRGLLRILGIGLFFIAYNVWNDVRDSGAHATTWLPFLLLGVALLMALGFEFVNGFHDTANAVATVIYTHSLPASVAVVWSGVFNFLGVLASSGVVAYGIMALLPVELILQVGSSAGFAMVFALLIGAIIWNLGTWYFGLPASSSHTLIGSIIGVGLANQLMAPAPGPAASTGRRRRRSAIRCCCRR